MPQSAGRRLESQSIKSFKEFSHNIVANYLCACSVNWKTSSVKIEGSVGLANQKPTIGAVITMFLAYYDGLSTSLLFIPYYPFKSTGLTKAFEKLMLGKLDALCACSLVFIHVALSIKSAVSKLGLIQKCSCVYHLRSAYKGAGIYKVF